MSTILNTNGAELTIPVLNEHATGNFYIITADWNPRITHTLRDGAIDVLRKAGVADNRIRSLAVPGTVELVNAAAIAQDAAKNTGHKTEAVIVIGCVIRGDTPHFDYVCQIASLGVAMLNAKGIAPVIFGVLTVDNENQALERAGGCLGNKGSEAGVAAISMVNLTYLF